MSELDCLTACRELLAECTPLESDCGAVCGAACCHPLEGEETGMLLFPGEERFYRDREGFRLLRAETGWLLVCPGHCRREERPLACRVFPLLPVMRGEEIRVAVDARARAVCPLRRVSACAPAFVGAVREAGRLLAADPEQAPFLERLTMEQDQLREVQRRFGGG